MGGPDTMPRGAQQPRPPLEEPHLEQIQCDPESLHATIWMEFPVQQQPIPRTVEGLQWASLPDRAGAAVDDAQITEYDRKVKRMGPAAPGGIFPVQEVSRGPGTDPLPGRARHQERSAA